MAAADIFFKEAQKKTQKTKGTQETEENKTYSANELKGVKITRNADGKVDAKASYYCISMRIPKDLETQIKDRAWESRKSVTEYIIGLIKSDLKKKSKAAAKPAAETGKK